MAGQGPVALRRQLGPVSIVFQRWQRVAPDETAATVSSFGPVPIASLDEGHAAISIREDESVWIGFEGSDTHACAARVLAQGTVLIDAVTGSPPTETLDPRAQNYIVVPPQYAITGRTTAPGCARQFVRVANGPHQQAIAQFQLVVHPSTAEQRPQAPIDDEACAQWARRARAERMRRAARCPAMSRKSSRKTRSVPPRGTRLAHGICGSRCSGGTNTSEGRGRLRCRPPTGEPRTAAGGCPKGLRGTPMSHTLTTVIAPLARERVESARTLIDALGNPASEEVRLAMKPLSGLTDSPAVHFLSVNAFAGQGERGYLVLELSGDGQEQELLNGVATCIPALTKIFALASDRGHSSLTSYWKAHVVKVGNGYFSNPGLGFAGAPGFSVRRILLEARVATHVMQRLEVSEHRESSALARLEKIRAELSLDSSFKDATVFETAPVLETERPLTFSLGLRILWSFVRTYLWPGVLPVVAVFLLGLFGPFPAAGFRTGLRWSWWTAVTAVVLGIAAAIAAYRTLRGREDRDASHDLRADPDAVRRVVEREDRTTQNHLASLYEMKPGKLRRFTVRLAFWLIGELASRHFRPGFLGALGTIHFARWVMVRGTGDLFFFSNYSGSWESYLEDFITRANRGLTAVWSNTRDFPRTVNLFELGASDGARFKRWARRWQIPTGFWYSAYPDLSTAAIRRNAAMRQGLAHARTEEEAARWMTLFGSETRPASALEMNEIQSLVFGGLGFLPSGLCLGFRLSGSGDRAKQWLQELLNSGMVAFGDGRKRIETNGQRSLGSGPRLSERLDSTPTLKRVSLKRSSTACARRGGLLPLEISTRTRRSVGFGRSVERCRWRAAPVRPFR